MKNVSKQTLKAFEILPQKVNSQEYEVATIEVKDQIQTKEHVIEELQENQIDPTLDL